MAKASPEPLPLPDDVTEPPREKYVTLKDVARRAGVHFTTVSLALRRHPGIPAQTRLRLMAIAKELGYSPRFAAG